MDATLGFKAFAQPRTAHASLGDIVTDAQGRTESVYDSLKRLAAWHRATASVHTNLSVQFGHSWTPEARAAEKAKVEEHFRAAEEIEQQIVGLA